MTTDVLAHLHRVGRAWSIRMTGHRRVKARDLGTAKRMAEAMAGQPLVFKHVDFERHWTARPMTDEERDRAEARYNEAGDRID